MSLSMIRNSRRFAVRHEVQLRGPDGRDRDGLLIELSLGGCRISRLADVGCEVGQQVSVHIAGFDPFSAQVRSADEGVVGLRLIRPLHCAALERMIGFCRGGGREDESLRLAI